MSSTTKNYLTSQNIITQYFTVTIFNARLIIRSYVTDNIDRTNFHNNLYELELMTANKSLADQV